ncbi:MAG TPA: hypothetical protein VFZ15_05775 [Acidimicrobiia bacterium]|nr:hypothetical protein [Acidimicrobiia bacterium]
MESIGLSTASTRRWGGSRILPIVFVVMAACTTSAGETTKVPDTTTTTSTTTTDQAASTTIAATTTTAPVDPDLVVSESLAASSANYRFTSVVLVGEQTLTTISGAVDGGSVAADVVTGSGEVSYVRTPDGEWVTGPDGEWVELEGEPPVAPPLGALVDAGNLVLESGDGTRGVFTGTLGPAAGEAQGLGFSLTVESGLVTEVRYQVDTGGEMAQVITTLSDFGGAGTVTAPDGV